MLHPHGRHAAGEQRLEDSSPSEIVTQLPLVQIGALGCDRLVLCQQMIGLLLRQLSDLDLTAKVSIGFGELGRIVMGELHHFVDAASLDDASYMKSTVAFDNYVSFVGVPKRL